MADKFERKPPLTMNNIDRVSFMPMPNLIGRRYRHYKGGIYVLKGFLWNASFDRWEIHYADIENPAVEFTRWPDEFFSPGKFEAL
jgi:hypothetical protein